MKTSNELEKSRGVLLFAFNSKSVNYSEIATVTAKLIKKHLNLPITLVTDSEHIDSFLFDTVILVESKAGNFRYTKSQTIIEWRNFDRYRVYELSPYDETLLIDVDYLVLDSSLLTLFDQDFDYRFHYTMTTPEGLNIDEMGPMSLPMVWATVVLFKKSKKTKLFFDLVGKIQRNYGYYRALFGIRETNYRNDFAFSMANIILNGYCICPEQSIPWPLFTIEENIISVSEKNKLLIIKTDKNAHVVPKKNIHIMDKNFLQSTEFKNLVMDICNE
jgi:hypothetical protein